MTVMKGFIFDLDGTLADSMPSWQMQLDQFLTQRGINPPADLLDRTKTLGLENATAVVLQEFGIQEDPNQAYLSFEADMAYRYCNTIQLKPGVRYYLDWLYSQQAPMAIATATSRPLVEQFLAAHQLSHYFQSITTVAEVGIGKHDPRIFLTAAAKLGLPARQCTVFEDSLKAVQSANAAGFRTVAIYEATNPVERQQLQQEADQYIHDFRELKPLEDDILE